MECSMETDRERKNAAIAVIRWSARVLGVITAGFFLFIFIAESWGNWHTSFQTIEPIAAIGLALMGTYIVTMFLALKWERAGSLLGLAALGSLFVMLFLGLFHGNTSGGFSPKGVLNPFLLAFWLPVLLYLLCWGLERLGRERTKAVL
jgi:hypothetical protein